MLLLHFVLLLNILQSTLCSTPSSSSSQRGRQTKGVRLFGVDLNSISSLSTSPAGTYENPIDVSSYQSTQRPPCLAIQNEIASLDPLVATLGLEHLLNDHRFTKDQKEALMERHLIKYQFNVLDPKTMKVEPVSLYRGHGRSHYIGHPASYSRIRREVTHNFPDQTAKQMKSKQLVLLNLEADQKAMRHLHRSPEAAIAHEPSGVIFLSPKIRHDEDLLRSIKHRHELGLLPKLRYSKGRMHFKSSPEIKRIHRNPYGFAERQQGGYDGGNGKRMEEETSSEEE